MEKQNGQHGSKDFYEATTSRGTGSRNGEGLLAEALTNQDHSIFYVTTESFGQRCSNSKKENSNIYRTARNSGHEQANRDIHYNDGNGVIGYNARHWRQNVEIKNYIAEKKDFTNYVKRVVYSYKNRKGGLMSNLLCVRHSHVLKIKSIIVGYINFKGIVKNECSLFNLREALIAHVQSIEALLKRKLIFALNKLIIKSINMLYLLQPSFLNDETWAFSLMYEIYKDLGIVKMKAATVKHNNKMLDLGVDVMLYFLGLFANPMTSKIAANLLLNNEIITFLTQMKTFDCRKPVLIDTYRTIFKLFFVEEPDVILTEMTRTSYLQHAFDTSPLEYQALKILILIRLEPLLIMQGSTTPINTLQRYGLTFYSDLGVAVRTGDLKFFQRLVQNNRHTLLTHGVFEYINVHLRSVTEFNNMANML